KCQGCFDDIKLSESVSGRCKHIYCTECIARLARATLTDESLLPLRCCNKPFDSEEVEAKLPSDLLEQFNAKRWEYAVPAHVRVYCAKAGCSAFLGASEGVAYKWGTLEMTCVACGTTTCVRCRQAAHAGRDCVQESTAQFDALVKERNWKRCPWCGSTVERTEGCSQMTCRCGKEFCYKCGKKFGVRHKCK
ncbi:hypothetical protein K525DRAFT_205272, partial [Schizophyllum commune Loenen D]